MSSVAVTVRFLELAFFHGRLNQVIRAVGFPANGQRKHKKCSKQNAVELELPACQRRHAVCVNELCEVCHANGLDNQHQR